MLKFNGEQRIKDIRNALALRSDVEKVVDQVWMKGPDMAYYLGIGGTYASAMQAVTYVNGKSNLPAYIQHVAECYITGSKCLTEKSFAVLSSVTGTAQEVVQTVQEIKEVGATLLGFIDTKDSLLTDLCDYAVTYPASGTEQIKFFMVADHLVQRNNEFTDYEGYYQELEKYLPTGLAEAEKNTDAPGLAFAEKHRHDSIYYFIDAGNQQGAVYSYVTCYREEQSWLCSRSIHAARSLYETPEIVDETTSITLFIGEDEQRPLTERVVKLLPKICANYAITDSKAYELPGISERYRGRVVSFPLMYVIVQRIDAHVEKLNCHPLKIRRYYRQLDY